MKIFAMLLAFNVLVLTAVPTVSLFASVEKTHCQKNCCATASTKGQAKTCNGMGNPFMACCHISSLTSNPQHISIASNRVFENVPLANFRYTGNYNEDTWHPPQIG